MASEQPHPELSENEIYELRERVNYIRSERDGLFDRLQIAEKERDTFRDKRDELNKFTSENFGKVRDLKEKRDSTNETIRELKTMRQSVLDEMRLLIKKAQSLREEIPTEGRSAQGRADSRRVRREIEEYEWRIQTTPGISVEEERQIMSEISRLSTRLGELEASEETRVALRKVNKEISNLKGYLDDSWDQLQELVTTSQDRHQRLTELYDEGRKNKEEADHNHKLFLERAEEVRKLREQIREFSKEIREKSEILRNVQTKRRQTARVVRDAEVRRVMDEKAKVLLDRMGSEKQRGKRTLTFDEMQVLMSQDDFFAGEADEVDTESESEPED
ncbi:MAG: coiled-coil protein [Candidatus Hodarchaeota archaeon]